RKACASRFTDLGASPARPSARTVAAVESARHSYIEGSSEQTAMQQYLRPGMIFYDIGANIGFLSLLGARIVGKDGRVFAFEPDPELGARLRVNVRHNDLQVISVEEKAVWCESGTVCFARADPATSPDRGLGHIVARPAGDTIQINTVSLDDFVLAAPAPDFLKCDV